MKGLKKGINRFLEKGPVIKCSDCGEKTIFKCGTVLGELPFLEFIPESHLNCLYKDIVNRTKVISYLCSECSYQSHTILWLVVNNKIRGPLCETCFTTVLVDDYGGDKDLTEDTYVYFINNNKTTQSRVNEIYDYFKEAYKDAEIIFNPQTLF